MIHCIPVNSNLVGNISIVEIYFWHKKSYFQSCKSASCYYFSILASEKENGDLWLYAPLNKESFEQIRLGKVQTNDAFKKNETGIVYSILLDNQTGNVLDEKAMLSSEIPEDYLHDEGVFLEESSSIEKIRIDAIDTNRHQFEFKLETVEDIARDHITSFPFMAEVMKNFQDLVNCINKHLLERDGKKTQDKNKYVHLYAWGTPVLGSFGLQLEAEKMEGSFKYNVFVEDTFSYLFNLIDSLEANEESLKNELIDNGMTQSLIKFGKHLKEKEAALKLDWASPKDVFSDVCVRRVRLGESGLKTIVELPIKEKRLIGEEVVVGTLDTISKKNRNYILKALENEALYAGKFSEDSIEISGLVMDDVIYSTKIEIWELQDKGKKKIENVMVAMEIEED